MLEGSGTSKLVKPIVKAVEAAVHESHRILHLGCCKLGSATSVFGHPLQSNICSLGTQFVCSSFEWRLNWVVLA